jgi:hypothetical protein
MRENEEKHKKLIRLIRKISREEAYSVLDEHLDDFRHEEQSAEEVDVE